MENESWCCLHLRLDSLTKKLAWLKLGQEFGLGEEGSLLDWLSEMTAPICIPSWVRQGTETNYFISRTQQLRKPT